MDLLIYFALPVATILLAIVFERVFRMPVLVTAFLYAIYLIVIFSLYAFGVITNLAGAIIALTVYTIIAFITAYLSKLFRSFCNRMNNINSIMEVNNIENSGEELIGNNTNGNTLNNGVSVTGRIIPNQINAGRTGFVRGCYRRY